MKTGVSTHTVPTITLGTAENNRKENFIEFLKTIFSEDATDVGNSASMNEFTYLI